MTCLQEVAPASLSSEASEAAVETPLAVEFTTLGLRLSRREVRNTDDLAIARDNIGTIEIDVATTAPDRLLRCA